MIKNARQLSLMALMRIEEEKAYSNIVLNSFLEKYNLSFEEKSLATRIVYGIIEKKKLLDYNISLLSKKSVNKLDVDILNILRMGMYQLLFMDNIPPNAAVNESVKLCSFTKKKSASGFVNALLRNKLRQQKRVCLPDRESDLFLPVKYSVDESIVEILIKDFGKEKAESILSAFENEPKQFIKVNTLKVKTEDLIEKLKKQGIEIEEFKGFLYAKSSKNLLKTKEFSDGEFFIQDMASQMCAKACEGENAERILDVCAAPGGKSFSLAIDSGAKAQVVSCDLSENRVSLIKSGMQRLGLNNVNPIMNDATVFNSELSLFDRVLCDVVCSGIGVMAKKPEIRHKKIEPDALFSVQSKILETSSKYLKEGGILIYSTCTLNKRENQDVIEDFLSKHKDFKPHPLMFLENGSYFKTLLPDEDGCDGFFISAIEKKKG